MSPMSPNDSLGLSIVNVHGDMEGVKKRRWLDLNLTM